MSKTGRKASDIRGERFGRLVAEHPTERRDYKGCVFWRCRCDCGGTAEASGAYAV